MFLEPTGAVIFWLCIHYRIKHNPRPKSHHSNMTGILSVLCICILITFTTITHSQQCTIKQQWSQDQTLHHPDLIWKFSKIKSPNCCKHKIICPLLHSIVLSPVCYFSELDQKRILCLQRTKYLGLFVDIVPVLLLELFQKLLLTPEQSADSSTCISPFSLSPGSLRSSTELVNLHF